MAPSPDEPSHPFLQPPVVQARRQAMGLEQPVLRQFVDDSEFISLGNHCVTAFGLQALDLKRRTYPFDWLRSPMSGVIQLLETDFEDFLTYTTVRPSTASKQEQVYAMTRWGGSFWHHNVDDPKTAEAFTRRIERLLGDTADVPSNRRRIFVRALNCTRELDEVLRLQSVLRSKLPQCQILMLLLVDLQDSEELLRTQMADILVYRVDGSIFAEDYKKFNMQICVENYARAISSAVAYWAEGRGHVRTVADYQQLSARCQQFDAGCTGTETFWPRRFKGQRISLSRKSPALPSLLRDEKDEVQMADWVVPAGVSVGDVVRVTAFGQLLQLTVPHGATPGCCLRFSQAQGAVTAAVLTASAVTIAASAASAAASQTLGLTSGPPSNPAHWQSQAGAKDWRSA